MAAEQPNEIWRDVEGYEGYYQVSNLGHVKSLDRTTEKSIKRRDNVIHKEEWARKGKILRPVYPAYRQDMYVHLYKTGEPRRTVMVKQLVAQAFLPEYNDSIHAKSIHLIDKTKGVTADNLMLGYKPGSNHSIKIRCNEIDQDFDSILQCAKTLGVSYRRLRTAIKSGETTYKNYTFTLL